MINQGTFKATDLVLVARPLETFLTPVGTCVRLVSGGPVGVVLELNDRDEATVVWLTQQRQVSVLPQLCLQPAHLSPITAS